MIQGKRMSCVHPGLGSFYANIKYYLQSLWITICLAFGTNKIDLEMIVCKMKKLKQQRIDFQN